MATLTGEQLKDSYQSLVTIGDTITSDPTSGVLENGKGTPITDITIGGDITIADKIIHSGDTNTAIRFPSADTVTIETAGSERLRVDSSGNVGISTTSLTNGKLSIQAGTSATGNSLFLQNLDGTYNSYLQIQHSSSGIKLFNGNSFGGVANNLIFGNASTSETMRIDGSGNVLVGKTVHDSGSTAGFQAQSNGQMFATVSALSTAFFNRLSSDGDIMQFRKDGSTVGSIGSISGKIFIDLNPGAGGAGLRGGSSSIIPYVNGADADDVLDLGTSGVRFDDVYATNGTIQTSDRNEKQDIEELNDAELRVAQKAKTLLRKFRWKSSVAENENARIHFGIIAQDLEQAFADEGLDAGRYGMFIKSTWTNEQGEEQTRLGVRYNQLLAFIISAL